MRRRFVQRNGELIEVTLDYQPEPRGADHVLWNDRSYQDCGDPRFASRTQQREYMKRHGLTTVDDFTGHFERAAKERAKFFTTGEDQSRRADIARAMEGKR